MWWDCNFKNISQKYLERDEDYENDKWKGILLY